MSDIDGQDGQQATPIIVDEIVSAVLGVITTDINGNTLSHAEAMAIANWVLSVLGVKGAINPAGFIFPPGGTSAGIFDGRIVRRYHISTNPDVWLWIDNDGNMWVSVPPYLTAPTSPNNTPWDGGPPTVTWDTLIYAITTAILS